MVNKISPKKGGRGVSLTILLVVGKCISLHVYLQTHSAGISCSPICGQENRHRGEMVHTPRTVPQNCSRVITMTNLRQPQQSWHFTWTKRSTCILHLMQTCSLDMSWFSGHSALQTNILNPCFLPQQNLLQSNWISLDKCEHHSKM